MFCPSVLPYTVSASHTYHDEGIYHGAVNVTDVKLEQAVQGYKDFDKGAAKKFVLDPHGMVAA